MDLQKLNYSSRTLLWIIGGCLLGVFINLLFLFLARNLTANIKLLRQELFALEQNQRIIQTAQEVYAVHAKDIDLFANVFPTEMSLPAFLTKLEEVLGKSMSGYTVKFNSIQPIPEGERLYLLLTINTNGTHQQLDQFFSELEVLPYMTHIISIQTKTQSGFAGMSEFSLGLKVYVQNPFTSK